MPRALIAGAGIGGLTAALALSQVRVDVTLFERTPEWLEFGAGLQLSPNGARILARLGVLDEVRALALAPRAISLRRGRDDVELTHLSLIDAERRWGAPFLAIHRADLQGVLSRALAKRPNVELRLGETAARIAQDAQGVQIETHSTRETGDFLIGADGLHSKVREELGWGKSDAAIFSGRVAFRATLPSIALATRPSARQIVLRLGPRAHLVQYPLRGGGLINLVAVIESGWRGEPPQQPWDGVADRAALERAFADWSKDARALIAAPDAWRAWPLYHREPLASFARGRIALLGDAAHPMVPFLAQGAAQAIEDAGALARRIGESNDIPAALAAYSRDRVGRAGRVQREALAQTRIYHMSGPLALARDMTMLALGSRLHARYDWIYSA